MERRTLLKLFLPAGAAVIAAENALAEPSKDDLDRIERTIKDSGFAGYTVPDCLNVLSHADYDLMHIPAGHETPERWHFFVEGIGAAIRGVCPNCGDDRFHELTGKNLLMTNMYRGNQYPPPESRVIERIVFLFSPLMNKEDRDKLISRSFWEFQVADKNVGRAPLAWTPTEGELSDLFEFDGQFPKRIGRNTNTLSSRECVHLAKPVRIESMQYFSFTLHIQPFKPVADMDLYVLLDGRGAFGVQ